MPVQISVLASGSGGNATLLATAKTKLLIDAGIGPRLLAERLRELGLDVGSLDAVLLTHLHHDHFRPPTLSPFIKHKTNVCCHQNHVRPLARRGDQARRLALAGLLWAFREAPFRVGEVEVLPMALPHDDEGGSFGFLFSFPNGRGKYRMGYLTDLGHVPSEHLECSADCDVLALEHNHDLGLLESSGRPAQLKARIRGQLGHLSNAQAAGALWTMLEHSGSAPKHLFLMHLSRECNRPELPIKSSSEVLAAFGAQTEVHLTYQHQATPPVTLGDLDCN